MDLTKPLELLPFTDPMLQTAPPEFDFENPQCDPKELVNALTEAMYRMNGVGLSANQVGIPLRVFVYGMGKSTTGVFNPKIMGLSKETSVIKEGCLSLPGVFIAIKRSAAVVASFATIANEPTIVTLDGIEGRIWQHEYDHMEGRNFTMLASPLKMQRALSSLKKSNREARKNAPVQ